MAPRIVLKKQLLFKQNQASSFLTQFYEFEKSAIVPTHFADRVSKIVCLFYFFRRVDVDVTPE